ncbi:UNVERIFIED_CONTAM: hypothetical protein FKN15_069580 [Acipenser sinensis]
MYAMYTKKPLNSWTGVCHSEFKARPQTSAHHHPGSSFLFIYFWFFPFIHSFCFFYFLH